MKRGKVLMTVLVVLAVLFASCSNGMSKDDADGASTKVVSVSLGIDVEGEAVQKAISTNTDLSGMTFWYKATPKWQQDYPIHGGTSGFVQIPNCTAGNKANLGNFTAGTWLFEVEVRKGSSVVYSGNTIKTIYTGGTNEDPTANSTVVIVVTPDTDHDGYVTITVKVPTTGAAEKLYVDYTGPDSDTDVLLTRDPNGPGDDENDPTTYNLVEFTGTVNDLTPGAYTFAFKYLDANGTQLDTGTATAVNVFAGQESIIRGLLDGKHWVFSYINIKTPGFSAFTVTAAGDNPTAQPPVVVNKLAPSTNLVFTASATTTIAGHNPAYKWYVDGVYANNATNSFTFNKATPKLYEVTCVASDGTDYSESRSRYIEVGYGDSAIVFDNNMEHGTVELANAGAIYAVGDLVPLTIIPADDYRIATLTATYGNDEQAPTAFDAASNTGSFKLPEGGSVTVSATFTPLYAIGLPPNVLSNVEKAAAGDIVKLKPATGYHFNSTPTVTGGVAVTSYGIGFKFTMPGNAVTVTADVEQNNP